MSLDHGWVSSCDGMDGPSQSGIPEQEREKQRRWRVYRRHRRRWSVVRTFPTGWRRLWPTWADAASNNGLTETISGSLEHLRSSALRLHDQSSFVARSILDPGGFRSRLTRRIVITKFVEVGQVVMVHRNRSLRGYSWGLSLF